MIGDIFGFVAVFLLSWWGVGSSMVYLVNIFRFQIPFSRTMVKEGVYDEKTHKSVLSTKWIGALVTMALGGGAVVFLDLRLGYMGPVMTVLGILVGFVRGRHILGYNVSNVCRFVRTHSVCMDRKKTAAFLKREYELEMDKIVPPARR